MNKTAVGGGLANIEPYWDFAADSGRQDQKVIKVDGAHIKTLPSSIPARAAVQKLSKAQKNSPLWHVGEEQDRGVIIDHFKQALVNKYGQQALRDLFSEEQERAALDRGLGHSIVFESAQKESFLEDSNKIMGQIYEIDSKFQQISKLVNFSPVDLNAVAMMQLNLANSMVELQKNIAPFKEDAASHSFFIRFQNLLKEIANRHVNKKNTDAIIGLFFFAASNFCKLARELARQHKGDPEAALNNAEKALVALQGSDFQNLITCDLPQWQKEALSIEIKKFDAAIRQERERVINATWSDSLS